MALAGTLAKRYWWLCATSVVYVFMVDPKPRPGVEDIAGSSTP